jgi:hypothetical protein
VPEITVDGSQQPLAGSGIEQHLQLSMYRTADGTTQALAPSPMPLVLHILQRKGISCLPSQPANTHRFAPGVCILGSEHDAPHPSPWGGSQPLCKHQSSSPEGRCMETTVGWER